MPVLRSRVTAGTLPPPVELFDAMAHPDGHHDVRSPGGYEWWYFDAESADRDVRLVAILLDGFVFHPGYLRRHAAYLRRPTRVPPPTARDYPCAYFVVYRGGRIVGQFMSQYPPGSLDAARDEPRVDLGPNRLRFDGGDYRLRLEGRPWRVTARGPQVYAGRTLSADLTFKPVAPPMPEREFFSRRMTGATHRWHLAAPRCDVRGEVDLGDGSTVEFAGLGYHDHNYGTAPIGPGLRRWIWGRCFTRDGGVTVFHHADPRDASLPAETHLIAVGEGGVSEPQVRAAPHLARWTGRTGYGLSYPRLLDLHAAEGGDDPLQLDRPRVIDSQPFYLRLAYETHSDPADRAGGHSAFCEVAHPHRLRWPVLGRMIEMSVDRP